MLDYFTLHILKQTIHFTQCPCRLYHSTRESGHLIQQNFRGEKKILKINGDNVKDNGRLFQFSFTAAKYVEIHRNSLHFTTLIDMFCAFTYVFMHIHHTSCADGCIFIVNFTYEGKCREISFFSYFFEKSQKRSRLLQKSLIFHLLKYDLDHGNALAQYHFIKMR